MTGRGLVRPLRAERLKITTTSTWWLVALSVAITTGLGLVLNIGTSNDGLHHGGKGAPPGGYPDVTRAPAHLLATYASSIYTSGQFFGCLFAMLLGILLMTNEYHYRTITTTFLATPRRGRVVAAKLVTAVVVGGAAWGLSTVIDLGVGVSYFRSQHLGNSLGAWPVERALMANLAVFALWSILGLGLGVLVRSQFAATVGATLTYAIGARGALGVLELLRLHVYHHDGIFRLLVLWPTFAAQVVTSPRSANLPDGLDVDWWVGAVIIVAEGAMVGGLGALLLRRRDIA